MTLRLNCNYNKLVDGIIKIGEIIEKNDILISKFFKYE